MSSKQSDYQYSDSVEPHIDRTKEIIRKYPEIKKLMGRNPSTFLWICLVVFIQVFMAIILRNQAWWFILAGAYFIGAFANHALFVLIHECTHNLIFKGRTGNMWAGIFCDLPNGFPSSVQFRKYHLKHHAFQGHYDIDADLPSKWEARLIGNSFLGKALWLLFFPIFQGLRPVRLKAIQFNSKWTWINFITVVSFDLLVIWFLGWGSFLYLFLSFFFSIGLHPLGARWIQEHYLVAPPQETYSYYGPFNKLAFNVGYHNEHHDFSFVPWNKLPEVRAVASEYYDSLVSHKSWFKLLWQFLTDKNLSLFSRVLREDRAGTVISKAGETDFFNQMKRKEKINFE